MVSLFEKVLMFIGGTGSVWTVGRFLVNKLQPKTSNPSGGELAALVNYWRREAELGQKKYTKLLDENTLLKIERNMLNSTKESIPVAMWEKDLSGRMVWCSHEYETCFLAPFGKTKMDVMAKTDEEAWGIIGEEWAQHDRHCIDTGESWYGKEVLPKGDTDLLATYQVYKNVIMYGNRPIGTLGLAIEIKKYE